MTRFQSVNHPWNFQAVLVQFLGCSGTPIGYKMVSCELLLSCEMSLTLLGIVSTLISRPSPKYQLGLGPNNAILGKPNKEKWYSTVSDQPVQHHMPPYPYTYTILVILLAGVTYSKARYGHILHLGSSKFKCLIITPGSILEFTVNSPFVGKII